MISLCMLVTLLQVGIIRSICTSSIHEISICDNTIVHAFHLLPVMYVSLVLNGYLWPHTTNTVQQIRDQLIESKGVIRWQCSPHIADTSTILAMLVVFMTTLYNLLPQILNNGWVVHMVDWLKVKRDSNCNANWIIIALLTALFDSNCNADWILIALVIGY